MKTQLLIALTIAGLFGCSSHNNSTPATTATSNISGVVWSDWAGSTYVGAKQGWIKGWVASSNKAVVCKHSFPAKGAAIYAFDNAGARVDRTISAVNYLTIDTGNDERTFKGDIAVVTVDPPWPANMVIYQIATTKPAEWNIMRQDQTLVPRAGINSATPRGWLEGSHYASNYLTEGDSGLPWFNSQWQVVSHSTRGGWGEGPDYSSPYVRPLLIQALNN